jgi:hypothetical protein
MSRSAANVCLIAVLAATAINLAYAFATSRSRYQLDFEEGNVLAAIERIDAGQTPYPSPHSLPIFFSPYGPAFYYSAALVSTPLEPSLLRERALIIAAAAASAVLIGLLVFALTTDRRLSALAGACYFALPVVREWLPILRADLLGVLLSLCGLWLFQRRRVVAPAALFALALFAKPTFIAAPLAALACLLLAKQWRSAAQLGATTAAFSLGLFLFMQQQTAGWFLFHVTGTHADEFSIAQIAALAAVMLFAQPVLPALATYGAFQPALRRRAPLALLYFLFTTVMLITAGKIGSTTNHFLEWSAATVLLAAVTITSLSPRRQTQAWVLIAATLLLSAALQVLPTQKREESFRECDAAYAVVQQHPGGWMLSENVGALVLAQKTVVLSNPFVWSQLVARKSWPEQLLIRHLEDRRFSLIILESSGAPGNTGIWSATFWRALQRNYRRSATFACPQARFAFEPVAPPSAATN